MVMLSRFRKAITITRSKTLSALALVALCAKFSGSEAVWNQETRETMDQIFNAVRVVLPLSVDKERFQDPYLEPKIRRSLQLLADNAEQLSEHAKGKDLGFEYLAGSLAHYAQEAHRRYLEGRYGSAEYALSRTTDFCVACHSRLPSSNDSPRAKGFVTDRDLVKLPPEQQAALLVATRQFDAALEIYEKLLADPTVHPAEMVGGSLTDYLAVSIRVKRDLERPIPVLQQFSRRSDLWLYLRSDVEHWIRALQEFQGDAAQDGGLQRARELINSVQRRSIFPVDRQALIHYLVASSLLHRFLEEHYTQGHSGPEIAEAYYLLGLTELRIGRDFWVSQAEHYLESAIRLAPKTDYGRRAYEVLEETVILDYSGSAGVNIPKDVARRLAELRCLLE